MQYMFRFTVRKRHITNFHVSISWVSQYFTTFFAVFHVTNKIAFGTLMVLIIGVLPIEASNCVVRDPESEYRQKKWRDFPAFYYGPVTLTQSWGCIAITNQVNVLYKICRCKLSWLVLLHYIDVVTHYLDVKLHIVHYSKSASNVSFHIRLAWKIKVNLTCSIKQS